MRHIVLQTRVTKTGRVVLPIRFHDVSRSTRAPAVLNATSFRHRGLHLLVRTYWTFVVRAAESDPLARWINCTGYPLLRRDVLVHQARWPVMPRRRRDPKGIPDKPRIAAFNCVLLRSPMSSRESRGVKVAPCVLRECRNDGNEFNSKVVPLAEGTSVSVPLFLSASSRAMARP